MKKKTEKCLLSTETSSDTISPVNVVSGNLNHSFTSNLSAVTRFVSEMEFPHLSGVCPLNNLTKEKAKTNHLLTFDTDSSLSSL